MNGPVPRAALLRSPCFLIPASLMMKPQKPAEGREEAGEGLLGDELDRVLARRLDLVHRDEVGLAPGDFSNSRSKVNFTSAEVISWPSWNLTPWPELERPREPVVADLPGLGQLGNRIHVRVEAHELAVHHGRAPAPREGGHELGIESRRLVVLGGDEAAARLGRLGEAPRPKASVPSAAPPALRSVAAASRRERSEVRVIGRHRRPLSREVPAIASVGVEDIAQAVAEEVEREHGHHDGDAREHGDPGRGFEIRPPLVQHVAPRRGGRLGREAEVAQRGLDQDGLGEAPPCPGPRTARARSAARA